MASCSALMTIFIIKMGTAKQAIDQGRSPVIIDNTNTQAWEMKPYVEMAIGKGYRVEFHEPETWWKFDPEELEKRNKHGVSRKKIAQMLDRYEFQMSISIVMNSVEPSQKSIQRPLPLPEEPRGRVLKKSGYRPDKPKQKRNRKGKKRNNSFSENSLATLGHLAPGSLGRSQSEGEGFEETERAGHPFAGSLQNEADHINNIEEQSWQGIEISNNSQNGVSMAELDHTPTNCFPEEEEDLVLTLPSVPSGSSASCHSSTQHLSCVGRDRCSGTRVEKHMSNRHKSALDTQNIVAKTPCSFPQKTEMKDKSRLDEHGGTRISEEVLREEQGVKSNCWAFFTASLSDEELQIRSKSQPYFGSWPKGPHEFVYEQRPKKNRSQRLSCPESEEQLIQLISTSEGAEVSGNCPEIPMEKQLGDLSPKAEMVDLPRNPETNTSSTCVLHPISSEHPLESARGTQGMQRRICNLPPVNPEAKEKCDLLTEEHHELNMFLAEEDISKMINKDETKQKMIIDCHLPWFYLDTLHDSPRSIVQQSCSYRLSFNRVGCAVYFYKNPVPSLMRHYLSSFCMLSFNNRRALLTFKSQKSLGRTLTDGGFILSDVLSGQPAALCSLRISPDTQFLNEKLDEELKTQEGREPVRCLPAEDSQDLISRNHQCYGPLSQELAFHPIKHFESPGVPIESLLPDDHVVPFDWKTLKIIPLPWKMPL
ncbi:NEDD4-binding protein 2-like 2 isoform X2 [Microtus ochrogaster]|uniref:NEDD4-binding protein 2-like 2 isoform X2 n=1 Tax=Microtus ochrogaster TaxID=79684 RepID=A0ABM1TVU8_MICOH|nr:NEDD4-binding protein 2-like 2 isoform X2 [Microtus ochrogaster]